MVGDQLSFLGGAGPGFFLISIYINKSCLGGGLGLLVVILALPEFALGGIANGSER